MPVSAMVAGVASLSISGVPPFSGFASKWTLVSASLLAGSEVFFLAVFGIIALFTSAVTLACYVKFFGMTFTSVGSQWNVEKEVKEVPFGMLLPKLVLTLLCIVQGLFPFFYFKTFIGIFQGSAGSILTASFKNIDMSKHIITSTAGVSLSVPGLSDIVSAAAFPVVILIIFALALCFAWWLRRSAGSTERTVETWLCGYQQLNDRNRYIDSGLFSSLKNVLWWTGGNPRK
jgi:NADH:ubiquinone oxidoreductase subunit 5 (subunit L)/multisubunit Na+/H+ antiporter MnhA subunit